MLILPVLGVFGGVRSDTHTTRNNESMTTTTGIVERELIRREKIRLIQWTPERRQAQADLMRKAHQEARRQREVLIKQVREDAK
jgi:hypothetical protein